MGGEADADHGAVVGLHPGDHLAPRLGPGRVQEHVAPVDQLLDRSVDVVDLELDAGLGRAVEPRGALVASGKQ